MRPVLATVEAMKALLGAMRQPESVVWEDARAANDGALVCMSFRARNGFGGMNREYATVLKGKASLSAALWNKHCLQPLPDMLSAAKRMLG